MTFILMLLAVVAVYFVSQYYAGEEGRIPSFSTARGKEARIAMGIVMVVLISATAAFVRGEITAGASVRSAVSPMIAGALVTGIRYAHYFYKKRK